MDISGTYNWSKYHILIVEDDILSFELVSEILSQSGIRISHAITGLEAIKICRKDESIDVVLMDMRLPEVDGYQATRTIKGFRNNLKVIAHTAHALSEDQTKCTEAGCDYYLTKPVNRVLLFQTINNVFVGNISTP